MDAEGTSHLEWEEEYREKESSFGIFEVYRVTRVSPAGQRGNFVIVDAPDWVTIVPVLKDERGKECFLMVRQYRHGSRSVTLEFPAGVVEWQEEPDDAARRELIEETGRTAGNVVFLGKASPNPSFMCNTTYTFFASGLGDADEQSLDELEEVELEIVPVEEVISQMGIEPYDNAIMMSALAYYLRWKSGTESKVRAGRNRK
jgi:ADP-ribose pyrophosphatase